jgi:hypothetical protein
MEDVEELNETIVYIPLLTLCNSLSQRRRRNPHCKCRRHEHYSEQASPSSWYMPCRMPQRFVLYRSRTCPLGSPCN